MESAKEIAAVPYDLPHDEKTIFSRVYKGTGRQTVERVVSVLLAHAEAERDINAMLDVLRDPMTSSRKKTIAERFLRQHAPEFSELCGQRDQIREHLYQTN